jgi:hypothetical protein
LCNGAKLGTQRDSRFAFLFLLNTVICHEGFTASSKLWSTINTRKFRENTADLAHTEIVSTAVSNLRSQLRAPKGRAPHRKMRRLVTLLLPAFRAIQFSS